MINRKLAKALSFRYVFLASIFVLLAAGLVLLPKYQKHEGIKPENLLGNAISPERYISTDELANKIINQDPSLLLIDVRGDNDFNNYTLPNAIHIPLKSILEEGSEPYLNQEAYDIVLFSNDNFYSDQAWIICNRLGYQNLHVLKGGMNSWFNTIINPEKPTEVKSSQAFELYTTRKASSMYFGVAYPELVKKQPEAKKKTIVKRIPKKVVPVKKKKKMPVEGGC